MSGPGVSIATLEARPILALALSVAAQTLGSLPVFFLGSLAPFILLDLKMDALGLGMAVAVYYAASAVGSGFLGRLADTLGSWRATRAGMAASVVALGGIALLAGSQPVLLGFLVVAGLANGWIQPSTNLAVSQFAGAGQGLAFGIKQSSIPLATLVGGFAVPLIALTLGWRWAFGFAGIAALALVLILPREPGRRRTRREGGAGGAQIATLLVLSVMSGLGSGSANAMAAFLVPSMTGAGYDPATAGLMIALGSLFSVATRITLGLAVDKRAFAPLPVVALLFAGGALGYASLALGGGIGVIAFGTLLGFGMGWGWSGLSILAVVRASAGAAGAATGITQAGVFAGSIFGPPAFGWIAQNVSFSAAWWFICAMGVLASAFALWGHRLLTHHDAELAEAARP